MQVDIVEHARQRIIDDDWERSQGTTAQPFPADIVKGLIAEADQLRRQVDALKAVIEHVDDEGKVPMAYILAAQIALHGIPNPTRKP